MNLNYNSYHAFEYAGTHYLFDNVNLFSCIVPLRTFDALKNKDCSMLNEEDLRLFEEFFKQKVFFIDNPDEQFYSPQYIVHSITLQTRMLRWMERRCT